MKEKLLLTFALLLTAVTGAWADDSGSCGDVSYSYVESTHTLTISGTGAMADYNDPSKRPWDSYATQIETLVIGNGVTRIGIYAFYACTGLTTVTIPASVTTIGNCAFLGCESLTTVTIGSGVTYIGSDVFYDCTKVEIVYCNANRAELTWNEGGCDDFKRDGTTVIQVANAALWYEKFKGNVNGTFSDTYEPLRCNYNEDTKTLTLSGTVIPSYDYPDERPWKDCVAEVENIVIENGVTRIGEAAFEGCESLTTVTIPASVTTIGDYAFLGCERLTTVTIPASVTSIGYGVFGYCSNIATMTVEAGNTVYDSRNVCNAIIEKESNTLIFGCKNTIIPDDVTSIGNKAFAYCTDLTTITIPASVTSIGNGVFAGCSNLATMTVEAGNTVYDSRNVCNAIIEKSTNTLIAGCKGTTIPTTVTSIGNAAFSSCSGLTSITIPTSVKSIGDYAFDGCDNLTSITIPASVKSIGIAAFQCCYGLTSITIPATVTSIGDYAFGECEKLATVTVFAPSCTLGDYAFNNCDKLANIYVLSDKVSQYKTTWSAYAEKISVMFDGTSTTTVNFDNDVTVNGVLYNRTFTASKPSTVMLPFSKDVGDIGGGKLYTFGGVQKVDDKWVATMNEVTGSLTKNTPYLFVPTGTSLTFSGGATLNTTGGGGKETADQGSHWTFKGTYEYKEWISGGANAEEIGKAYGFAGVAKTGIEVGDFVKVASGAKIRPMGCYLLWSDTPNASRAAARGAATEELPQSITVRLVSADGEVTGIGEIDTKTGEMTFDSEAWYTLNGVRLSGKPTKKGLYINNGKKVVIK